MELWDLYTRDRQLTGETHVRGEKLPPERYHICVNVWIRNSSGQWLISQRAADRPAYPLYWECVGGSITAGEDSLTAALREAEEEVGVRLSPSAGCLLHSTIRDQHQDIKDDWLFSYDGPVDLSLATTNEVLQTRWMTLQKIRELHDAGKFVPTLAYFFDDPELGGCP